VRIFFLSATEQVVNLLRGFLQLKQLESNPAPPSVCRQDDGIAVNFVLKRRFFQSSARISFVKACTDKLRPIFKDIKANH